jgi:hypothetical protein
MKLKLYVLFALLVIARVHSQGFVYDQQSATNDTEVNHSEGAFGNGQGQSFTPSLPEVDFIRLLFLPNSSDTTLDINLMSGSITGPIIGTTVPALLPAGGGNTDAVVTFYFSTPVVLIPGNMYYFEENLVSGPNIADVDSFVNNPYSGGDLYGYGNTAKPGIDLWFREGVLVPEPSSSLLFLIGSGVFIFTRKCKDIFYD